jgi:hypothetical protein
MLITAIPMLIEVKNTRRVDKGDLYCLTLLLLLLQIDREISFVDQENEEIARLRSQGKSDEELKLMGFKDIEMSPSAVVE